MSSGKLNLASEFEKIYIDPTKKKVGDNNAPLCEKLQATTTTTTNPSDSITNHSSHQSLKVSRKKNYIKPSRLKFIYKTLNEKESSSSNEMKTEKAEDAESYSGEAFLLLRDLRISPSEVVESLSGQNSNDEKDDRVLSTSCSLQYYNTKLQQQLSSSSEFDSTIDAMSDYFSYHLNLYKDKNFLVDSMYT